MERVKITQVSSTIKCPERQKRTIKALGLGRINRSVEVAFTPQIRGMVHQVNHLITTEKL